MNVTIRPERDEDHFRVEALARDAFWNLYYPGCDEHYLCHILRSHPDFIAELDYVAEVDGRLVGSIMYSKAELLGAEGEKVDIVSFGPLCVHPEFQRKGIGTALVGRTVELVRNMAIPAIAIYGDPHNYCKHGFRNGLDHDVGDLDGEHPLGLLVLELEQGFFGKREWKLRQSEVFKFDPADAEEFDKRFPDREKKWRYSQELFKMQIRAFLRKERLSIAST
ncbi:MAG: N-acetyltransferase [Spirochaetaceae bacterium]|nr:N-acetyltransferase [Spirochaetaceae bacterium]